MHDVWRDERGCCRCMRRAVTSARDAVACLLGCTGLGAFDGNKQRLPSLAAAAKRAILRSARKTYAAATSGSFERSCHRLPHYLSAIQRNNTPVQTGLKNATKSWNSEQWMVRSQLLQRTSCNSHKSCLNVCLNFLKEMRRLRKF